MVSTIIGTGSRNHSELDHVFSCFFLPFAVTFCEDTKERRDNSRIVASYMGIDNLLHSPLDALHFKFDSYTCL